MTILNVLAVSGGTTGTTFTGSFHLKSIDPKIPIFLQSVNKYNPSFFPLVFNFILMIFSMFASSPWR
ncbi:hypothetical protein CARUB_v10025123mg [Capsella rubella]|uniref:Uncharacterized protein n=1 Tax=Capsella rubella TaxID=81985 RepID=R0HXT0_9BRAS|nr:hypothetical protein CARUB_v10025123mg [Capsella rubella]